MPRGKVAWEPAQAALGRRLFRDPLLSEDRSVSCATCHDPALAFTDGRAISVGVGGKRGTRNTPTVLNRRLGRTQFWDGRAQTLEEQALGPIANPVEMNLPVTEAVRRLKREPSYAAEFQRAFGGPPTASRLAAALAAYQRTLYSVDSPYDRFEAGEETALSPAARRGLELFGGKAACGDCHVGPNFTDEDFHTLGVGGVDEPGRAAHTRSAEDRGRFKTPTLREVARTAPYMHDGSLATLQDVVDYYDRGGDAHPTLDRRVKPLGLTPAEKTDLVAFLEALSGRIIDFDGAPRLAEDK